MNKGGWIDIVWYEYLQWHEKDMSHFPLCVFKLFGFLELETDMNTRPQV